MKLTYPGASQTTHKTLKHKTKHSLMSEQPLKYKSKCARNIGRLKKKWPDQLDLESEETDSTSRPRDFMMIKN